MTLQIHILQCHIRHALGAARHIGLFPDLLQKNFQILPRYPHRHTGITQVFRALIVLGILIAPAETGHFFYVTAKRRNPFLDGRQKRVKLLRLHVQRHLLDQFPLGDSLPCYFRSFLRHALLRCRFVHHFVRIEAAVVIVCRRLSRLSFRIETAAGFRRRRICRGLIIAVHRLVPCTAAAA